MRVELRLSYSLALCTACVLGGCGLTVTSDRPSYQELDAREKQAVDVILSELTALDAQVKARTPYSIAPLVDREHIDVAFQDMIFVANLGDDQLHVATWENLSDDERALIQSWFQAPTLAVAQASHETLFYHFLAVSNGVKQFMYNTLTVAWVYQHRSLFNIERDSIRTALAHFEAVGRKTEMWSALSSVCDPVIAQYGGTYSANFDKNYLQQHYGELANGKSPTGYMYFICRWIAMGKDEAEDLTHELNWLVSLKTS